METATLSRPPSHEKYTLFIILILSMIRGNEAGFNCVRSCFCSAQNDKVVADCRGQQLKHIPQPTESIQVDVLRLEDNQITSITSDDNFTSYKGLKSLNLTSNGLHNIGENAFLNLMSLEKLDLSVNSLQAITEREIYHLENKLKWLSVAKNLLSDVPGGLSKFTMLEYLDISGNPLVKIVHTGHLPTSLLEINLAGTQLTRVGEETLGNQARLVNISLADITTLEYVDLSEHHHIAIERDTFNSLSNLKTLIMRNCSLGHAPKLSYKSEIQDSEISLDVSIDYPIEVNLDRSTVHWYNTKLQTLDLSDNPKLVILPDQIIFPPSMLQCQLSYTDIPLIYNDFMEYAVKVEKLDLCDSGVINIDKDTLLPLGSLKELCFSGNSLAALPYFPSTLKKVWLSRMELQNITTEMFKNLSAAMDLDLSDNKIVKIEDTSFTNMVNLQHLNLSGNVFKKINKDMLMVNGSSLKRLDLSKGLLEEIESGSFSSHVLLEYLQLNNNGMESFNSGIFDGLESLKELYLQSNKIVDIGENAFVGVSSLRVLRLDYNRMEILLPKAFTGLDSVTELHLQYNSLFKIHLISIPSLIFLDVSNNKLKTFPRLISKNLKQLNASGNEFEDFQRHNGTLSSLEILNLSSCYLEGLDYVGILRQATSLRTLSLEGTGLFEVPDMKMPLLRELHIGRNNIHKLSGENERFFENVSIINMRMTNFSDIDADLFSNLPSLRELILNGSTLPCTCDIFPFLDWATQHSSITKGLDAVDCNWPPEAILKSAVETVGELECGGGNIKVAAMSVGIILAAVIFLIILSFCLLKIYRMRSSTQTNDYELQPEGYHHENEGEQYYGWISSLRCCLGSKRNFYSQSQMRLYNDDDSEVPTSSTAEKGEQSEKTEEVRT